MCYIVFLEHLFENMNTKGERTMNENEMELLRMIREHENPEQALLIAVGVILDYLGRPGSSEEPSAACPPGPA